MVGSKQWVMIRFLLLDSYLRDDVSTVSDGRSVPFQRVSSSFGAAQRLQVADFRLEIREMSLEWIDKSLRMELDGMGHVR